MQEGEVEQLKFFAIEEIPKKISPPLQVALNKWVEEKNKKQQNLVLLVYL